jgi:trehalose 6-phosphate synthase/phosphatase
MGIMMGIVNRVSDVVSTSSPGPMPRTKLPLPVLWPLFHYLLWQDVATEYASADSHYPAYLATNLEFARRIAAVYTPGDLIWVHDYHLLLVPKLVREVMGVKEGGDDKVAVGLFVHTPFPSSEVFRCLPSAFLSL